MNNFIKRSLVLCLVMCLSLCFVLTGCKKEKPSPNPNETPQEKEIVATKLEITNKELDIYIGETISFNANIFPEDVKDKGVTWSFTSSKVGVAKLEGNVLTGLDVGKVYVTGTSSKYPTIHDTVTVNVKHALLEEAGSVATEIIGGPGEDASTEFVIHYQIKNTLSYALVTTEDDVNFEKATKVYGEGRWFADEDEKMTVPFSARNVWHIKVTGLTPNTKYIYKINNGDDTYSEVYKFRTAGTDKTSFVFLADVHYSMLDNVNYPSEVSETTIANALKINPNIDFVMGAGDLIDTGGNENIWKKFFSYAKSIKELPYAFVPGNHEYYINGTGQKDNSYFAAYSPLELNGPGQLVGSSSWFKHNDTLFIMVDNVKKTSYNEQLAWMADLLENQEYKYSVICFHIPVNRKNTDTDENFLKLFDKYSVDLVLSGHYHGHHLSINEYNGSKATEEYLGTTYMTGYGGGAKGWNKTTPIEDFAKGYIIDIDDKGIHINAIYANGNSIGKWTISNNRPDSYEQMTKDDVMASIVATEDLENNSITFSWPSTVYGNVKRIDVKSYNRDDLNDYSVVPSPAYKNITLSNYFDGYHYKFDVVVKFSDGEVKTKHFEFDHHQSLNPKVDYMLDTFGSISYNLPSEEMMKTIGMIELIGSSSDDSFNISYRPFDGITFKTSVDLERLKSNTTYQVRFVVKDTNGGIMFEETFSFTTE